MFVVNQHHPNDCRYEGYTVDALVACVRAFNAKSGLNEHDAWGQRPNVSVTYSADSQPIYMLDPTPIPQPATSARLTLFMDSGPDIQAELVAKAQGYAPQG